MRPQYAAAHYTMFLVQILPIIILVSVFVLVPFRIVRYMREMSHERRRLRLEVSKLAHEVEGLRADHNKASKAPGESSA